MNRKNKQKKLYLRQQKKDATMKININSFSVMENATCN